MANGFLNYINNLHYFNINRLCINENDDPKVHTGTIMILDTDIPVKGEAVVAKTYFDTAICNLEKAITFLDEVEKNNFINKISEIKITLNREPIGGYDGIYFKISYGAFVDDIVYLANLFEHTDTVKVLDKDIPVIGWNISADDFCDSIVKYGCKNCAMHQSKDTKTQRMI